jgi:hypothetical protein
MQLGSIIDGRQSDSLFTIALEDGSMRTVVASSNSSIFVNCLYVTTTNFCSHPMESALQLL